MKKKRKTISIKDFKKEYANHLHLIRIVTKNSLRLETKEEKQHDVEENSTTAEVFNTLDETASKTEDFVAKNQKYIFILKSSQYQIFV